MSFLGKVQDNNHLYPFINLNINPAVMLPANGRPKFSIVDVAVYVAIADK